LRDAGLDAVAVEAYCNFSDRLASARGIRPNAETFAANR